MFKFEKSSFQLSISQILPKKERRAVRSLVDIENIPAQFVPSRWV